MPNLKAAGIAAVLLAMAASAQAAGTLRVGMQDDPDALDPARGGTFAGRIVFVSLCDKLVDLIPSVLSGHRFCPGTPGE
jgi:peptide/nickel transport system substrate-binding protein